MPFIVVERDGRFCVYTEDGQGSGKPIGASHGCHDTREEAMAQMRALYANVPEARPKKGTGEPEVKAVAAPVEFKADDQGALRAVFSVFDVVDHDGDIVRKSAFAVADGREIPLCWSHDWSRPVGKGVIKVGADRAIFDGRFFLSTDDGRNAYETAKAMGNLQEFSWGFRVPADGQEIIPFGGEQVREITKAEVFEVSCVLKGAGIGTGILALKERWTSAYIADLPDSAFAVVTSDGDRKLPHHNADGALDLPHLRNALSRLPQADLSPEDEAKAQRHLEAHARSAGIGDTGKADDDPAELKHPANLRRGQMARARELAAELLSLFGAHEAEEAPTDDGKSADLPLATAGERLADDLAGYVARLVAAPDEDLRKDRDALAGFARRLSAQAGEVERSLDRATKAQDADPQELRRQYQELVARLGLPS